MLTDGMTSSLSKEWMTPDETYDPLNDIWGFTLDGAAAHNNAKVDRYCTSNGTFQRTKDVHGDDIPEPITLSGADGLNYPWSDEIVWLNAPWGESRDKCEPDCKKKTCKRIGHATEWEAGIAEFLLKARNESLRHRATVIALCPARTDNDWFHDLVLPYARIQWRRRRPHFINPDTGEEGKQPPVGVFVAVYR